MSGDPIRLDTHVVVWLHRLLPEQFSERALALIEDRQLVVSPIVELELTYLFEIGRITTPPSTVIDGLAQRIGLITSDVSTQAAVTAATALTWTRDPFDRLIVGDASAAACELLTKDRSIRDHYPLAAG